MRSIKPKMTRRRNEKEKGLEVERQTPKSTKKRTENDPEADLQKGKFFFSSFKTAVA